MKSVSRVLVIIAIAVLATWTAIAGTRKVIAHGAVLYDEHGDTWTFTSPAPLTFLRQKIDIDYITGRSVVLRDGPPAGTTVVTVGAAELLGAELGVGE